MSSQTEDRSIWDDISSLFAALYNAIRNGFASLAESIRRALARLGYIETPYYV